jgi:hypothetical protein
LSGSDFHLGRCPRLRWDAPSARKISGICGEQDITLKGTLEI